MTEASATREPDSIVATASTTSAATPEAHMAPKKTGVIANPVGRRDCKARVPRSMPTTTCTMPTIAETTADQITTSTSRRRPRSVSRRADDHAPAQPTNVSALRSRPTRHR